MSLFFNMVIFYFRFIYLDECPDDLTADDLINVMSVAHELEINFDSFVLEAVNSLKKGRKRLVPELG